MIGAAVEALIAALDPERVVVYGSRGRGDHRPDSDWDVLVLVDGPAGEPPLDIKVHTVAQFDAMRADPEEDLPPLTDKGRVLYQKGKR